MPILFLFQLRNFISLIETNINELHFFFFFFFFCFFFFLFFFVLPITLFIHQILVYPCPISLCKHEQNLRRYLDVYV